MTLRALLQRPRLGWAVLVVVLAITAFFGRYARVDRIEDRLEENVNPGPMLDAYYRFLKTFGNDRLLLIAFPLEGLDAPMVRMLTTTERNLLALPTVQGVVSPVTALRTQMGVATADDVETFLTTPHQLDRYRRNLKRTVAFDRAILSRDWQVGGMVVRLRPETGDLVGPVIADIKKVLHDSMPIGTRITGVPEITRLLLEMTGRDQRLFSPLTILLTAVVLFVLFRDALGLLLPLFAICSAFIWTKGLMVWQGHTINFVTSILPPMILSIALTYCVHILTTYFDDSQHDREFSPATLEKSLRHVAYPILLSATTTMIGFGSLLYASIDSIGQFGLYAAIGTAFSAVLTLVVLAAGLGARRRIGRVMPATIRGLEPRIEQLARAMIRHHRGAWLVIGLLLVVALYGLSILPIETSLIRYLPQDAEIQQANRYVEENLSGIVPFELLLESPTTRLTTPDLTHRVRRLQAAVASMPYIDKTLSYVDLIQDFDRRFSKEPDHIPGSEDEICDYLEFYAPPVAAASPTTEAGDIGANPAFLDDPNNLEATAEVSMTATGTPAKAVDDTVASAPLLIASFTPFAAGGVLGELLASDAATAHISIRHRDRTSREMVEGFRRIEALAAREFAGTGVRATITGRAALWAEVHESIAWNEITSFGFSLLVITVIIAGYFRSVKVGLVSMIPNVIPMVYTYGLMGLTGTTFNAVTGMIASIAIGLAVDDTIHIICQFQHELAKDGNEVEALVRTMVHKGRATVSASLILCSGFSVLALSDFSPTRCFGVFISIGVAAALLCELLITPVALFTFKPLTAPPAPGGRHGDP